MRVGQNAGRTRALHDDRAGGFGQPADMIRFLKIDKRIPVYDSVGEARDAQL